MAEFGYVSANLSAIASVGLGKTEEAIDSLWRAYEDRDDMLSLLKVDSPFIELRTTPRVVALLERIGLK